MNNDRSNNNEVERAIRVLTDAAEARGANLEQMLISTARAFEEVDAHLNATDMWEQQQGAQIEDNRKRIQAVDHELESVQQTARTCVNDLDARTRALEERAAVQRVDLNSIDARLRDALDRLHDLGETLEAVDNDATHAAVNASRAHRKLDAIIKPDDSPEAGQRRVGWVISDYQKDQAGINRDAFQTAWNAGYRRGLEEANLTIARENGNEPDEPDYDYTRDDMNFDAARERR